MSSRNRGRKPQKPPKIRPTGITVEVREQLLLQAVLAYRSDELADAEALCQQLLAQSARFAPAKLLLGMITGKTGRPQLGIESLREAMALDPEYLDPRIELAGLLNAEGQVGAAITLCEESLEHWPDNPSLYNMLGLALLNDGRAAEAAGSLQRAIALDPSVAIVHHNLGMALQAAGRDNEAIAAYHQAITLDSALVEAWSQLAHLLFAHGRRDEARECLRQGSVAQPDSATSLLLRAELELAEGRLTEAESLVNQVISHHPRIAAAHHLAAIIQQQAGRFDEASASYETTARLSPHRTLALLGLVMSRKLHADDQPLIDRLQDALRSSSIPDVSRADIHYALGKAFDDLADFEQAIWHLDAANAIVADRIDQIGARFDQQQHHANIEQIIQTFSAEFFQQRGMFGHATELPVLIVGMPRSGTTLVEQIVSSHPAIGAGGEQHFWPDRSAMLGQAMADLIHPRQLQDISEQYASTLRALAPEASRVTDKMPANFLLLGLIHLALPNARVIHCRRHPVDVCLSIYATPFSNLVNFARRREDIVAYYRGYAKLMAHWRRVLPPEQFHEIEYERLVRDHEGEARRLISFCGLEWDAACLRHERNTHPIHTPSWWQARQPVYRTSVDRWRRYEPWLGAFSQLLTEG
jgi:tetratricopeptide (TPR) repeat protein